MHLTGSPLIGGSDRLHIQLCSGIVYHENSGQKQGTLLELREIRLSLALEHMSRVLDPHANRFKRISFLPSQSIP
jgi:hypothetical protein